MRMRLIFFVLTVSALLFAGASPSARAQGRPSPTQVVIAGDLAAGETFQTGTGMAWSTGPGAPPCNGSPCDPANAVSFSVPVGTYYAMTQFKVAFNWSAGANSVTVGLYMYPGPDSATAVNGATLVQSFTMTSPGSEGTAELVTQVLNNPVLLMPGNTYYLEMINSNAGGDFGWQWNSVNQGGYYAAFLPVIGAVPSWGPENCDTCLTPAFEIDGQTIEPVYVSTQGGSQILLVDGNTGAYGVVLDYFKNAEVSFSPEGITVGPDGNLYITDPSNGNIWQMTPNGGALIQVASLCSEGCLFPQGPSFNGPDLYYNTKNGGVYEIPSAATPSDGFQAPVEIVPNASCTSNCSLSGGSGTSFDSSGNLLFDETSDGEVFSLTPNSTPPPPYTGSPSVRTDGLTGPTGIAMDKATGTMFVANTGTAQILQSNGTVYYPFPISAQCGDFTNADEPMFLQSDLFGSFFVVTTRDGVSGCAKLWRIDPPVAAGEPPTAVPLLDFSNPPAGSPTLHTGQAVGVALPPTQGPTQTFPLYPYPPQGTLTAGWPIGCTPSNTPGNNCSSTIGVQFPNGIFGPGDVLNVTFNETSQQQFMTSAGASPYAATTLAPVEGYNGNSLVPTLLCTNGGNPCNDTVMQGTSYNIFTTWQSNQTSYCTLTPHLLRGDPAGGPYTTLLDTIIGCQDGGVGTKGQSSCTSTSSSSCLSDWLNTFGPVPNGSTVPTVTITSPTNGAVFGADQSAGNLVFLCNPSAGNEPVVQCAATITNVSPSNVTTLLSVSNGNPIPTSLPGTNTLTVTAVVDAGPPVTQSVTYTVNGLRFIGFVSPVQDSPTVNTVKAGQTVPLAFQVLDTNGNPVTYLTMPPITIGIVPSPSACAGTSETLTIDDAAGNSGFQNLGGGNYQYNWKTSKSLAGTCERIEVGIGGSIALTADFQFK